MTNAEIIKDRAERLAEKLALAPGHPIRSPRNVHGDGARLAVEERDSVYGKYRWRLIVVESDGAQSTALFGEGYLTTDAMKDALRYALAAISVFES